MTVTLSPLPAVWDYLKRPGFEPRPLKIAIAGAGASGICLAIKIIKAQEAGTLGPVEFTLYEREDDFGGTWYVNRYPGCRCDLPAHAYTFSFAPYADWPEFYSGSAAINKYMHLVVERYGVEPFIKLRHTIRGADWNEEAGKWEIKVEKEDGTIIEDQVDVYVPATGVLSQVNRPQIKGLEKFTKNSILHTAEWPKDLDYTTAFKDERIAVIGIGSSGLQTIGAISPFSESIDIFARSKFWISPPFMTGPAGPGRKWELGNFEYSEEEKEKYRTDPDALYGHIKALSIAANPSFDIFFHDSPLQKLVKDELRVVMEQDLKGNQDYIDKLIPDWDVWCRRVTPCASFMEAIQQPHVSLNTSAIKEVTASGITTVDGKSTELDRIILATGFDTSFKPKYDVTARGKSLGDVWSPRPKAYISLAVAGFPNLFIMCGPGTIFANGSLLPGLEVNADYIIEALVKLQKQNIKCMEVLKDAQDDYNEQQEALMRDLVFNGPCNSWYKGGNPDANPDALYAGSTLQFMELIASPRWEDWKFTSTYRNRFSFLGNGIGTIEAKEGDRAYYLKYEDHLNPIHGDVKSNGVSKSLHKSDGAEKIDALASDAPAPLRFF